MSPPRWLTSCVLLIFFLVFASASGAVAQDSIARFHELALQVTNARLDGERDDTAALESALRLLDSVALAALNAPPASNLDAGKLDAAKLDAAKLDLLNCALAGYATPQPLGGESYRVLALDSAGGAFALLANFGLSGPGAVRLYARRPPVPPQTAPGGFALAARIDHATFGDFFDESVELAPIGKGSDAPGDVVFVTVSGRTDDLQTGVFGAWRLHDGRVTSLWTTELLPHSTYAVENGAFRVAFCSDVDDDRPRDCRAMVRERYAWSDGAWKRIERAPVPVPGR